MKIKIVINGKAVDAVLDDEQVKAALEMKHTGLEHPGYDGIIYALDGSQYTYNGCDTLDVDEFSDKQLRDDYARAMDIYRRLAEAAAMLNGSPIDMFNADTRKYAICWGTASESFCYIERYNLCDTTVLFETEEAARQAIDLVGEDDLIWLFRDFQPYIGAYKIEE